MCGLYAAHDKRKCGGDVVACIGRTARGNLQAVCACAVINRVQAGVCTAFSLHPPMQSWCPCDAGVHELERAGVRAALMNAVMAATGRANEMSKH